MVNSCPAKALVNMSMVLWGPWKLVIKASAVVNSYGGNMNLLVQPVVGFTRLSVIVELSMERMTEVPTATTRFFSGSGLTADRIESRVRFPPRAIHDDLAHQPAHIVADLLRHDALTLRSFTRQALHNSWLAVNAAIHQC